MAQKMLLTAANARAHTNYLTTRIVACWITIGSTIRPTIVFSTVNGYCIFFAGPEHGLMLL
jgi:hypothetical protein